MMANENFTESSSHSTNVIQGRANPKNSDNTEQVTLATKSQRKDRECRTSISRHENKPPALEFHGKSNKLLKLRWKRDHERAAYKAEIVPRFIASRKDCQYKIKSRAAQDLHWQAFQREDRVPLPPNWKTKYPQYTYKAGASPRHRNSYTGASSKPPRTSILNTQNWLKVRLQSKWKGHTITVHPFDWEEFKANEKEGHRKLTHAINFIKYWDQYVKDNPEDLKDMDQICASWVSSPCAGDNPYRAKDTVGDPRLLDYSSRRRQLQKEREKKWQHMRRTKERQEKSEKLSMIEDQIEELTLRVGRHQFS
ncbi:hypothetical protein BCON_0105g00170 [Botryotinia convoluta]|uniref:Uncharacterized protein n=1 Tax=Botryotinia convoluta TaxID=54673 RepID=A0A4Z1ICZ6_9HELO|nr:hypothetical protein BCON_0105g00170 [Botryotinia convoluta]